MQQIRRRSFLAFAVAALPLTAIGQSTNSDENAAAPGTVPAGADRFGKTRPIPTGSSAFKVATQDTGGALFVMENRNTRKGGPPLHLHHHEDELFYAIEGDYVVQVGSERHRLT
ncbi:MAG: cupin domain-containing protein, partial [Acidobacteria bacterium]|nr:cupin domain-containing protein [Acidobacteriota bacterium]